MAEGKRQRIKRTAEIRQMECVACGSCIAICPRDAIQVLKGVCAAVQANACVGCGKCVMACPASVIELSEAAG